MFASIDPTQFIDLDFIIRKISWSLYEINHDKVKGTIRVIGMPTNIYEVPDKFLPSEVPRPQVLISVQGVIGFKNEGKKGTPGAQLTLGQFQSLPKDDLTSFVTPRDEPFNEFIASRKGKPALLVRARTVLMKLDVVRDKFTPTGDPQIWVTHNTNQTVSESNSGEIYAK